MADTRARLLHVASSISDGTDVDWNDVTVEAVDEQTTAVVTQLQIVEQIARLHGASRAWDAVEVRDTVGRGTLSVVFRAFDPDFGREVALKVMRFGVDDSERLDRALKEARRMTRVRHPNLLSVLRADRRGNQLGLWLELVKGVTAADLVRTGGPLGVREAILVVLDICRALTAVHGVGLVHGDVNAHNVMRGQQGRIVLMECGGPKELARASDSGSAASSSALFYMAPELFRGAFRSRASDVYSVGVLLYYLVTGTFAVEGRIRTGTGKQSDRRSPRQALCQVRPDLPLPLVRAIERALQPRPDDRYATAAEFESALLDALPRTSRVLRRLSMRWPWRKGW